MTPDHHPQRHHPEALQTPASAQSSRPLKNNLLDDAIGIAIGVAVGWLGEIAMQSANFSLFFAN